MVGWPYSQVQDQYWIAPQYDSHKTPRALARTNSIKVVDDGEGASCFVTAVISNESAKPRCLRSSSNGKDEELQTSKGCYNAW